MSKPVEPVKPSAMEIVFFYKCPFCSYEIPLAAPSQPAIIPCSRCNSKFPIVPVDEYSVHFVKIMLANGSAAIDSDYL